MKRLLIAFLITIALGLIIYFVTNTLFKDSNNHNNESKMKEEQIKYNFDMSYGIEITIEEMKDIIKNNSKTIILIGKKNEKPTKKVSTILGEIPNIENSNIYYLEKADTLNNNKSYQELLTTYPELSNYLNFAPVILAFKSNSLIGGLPGEVEEKNIISFLEYTENLK